MSSQRNLWGANLLICGDNLEEVAKLPKESVDLIYISPPFFTNKRSASQNIPIWRHKRNSSFILGY